jgi:hypothetical protein
MTQFCDIATYPFPLPAQDSLLDALLDDVTARLLASIERLVRSDQQEVHRNCEDSVGELRDAFALVQRDDVAMLCSLRRVSKHFRNAIDGSSVWFFACVQSDCHGSVNRHRRGKFDVLAMLDTRFVDEVPFCDGKVDVSRRLRMMSFRGGVDCAFGMCRSDAANDPQNQTTERERVAVLTTLAQVYPHFVSGVCDAVGLARDAIVSLVSQTDNPIILMLSPTAEAEAASSSSSWSQFTSDRHARFFHAGAPQIPRRFAVEMLSFQQTYRKYVRWAVWVFKMFCFRSNRHIWCVFTIQIKSYFTIDECRRRGRCARRRQDDVCAVAGTLCACSLH